MRSRLIALGLVAAVVAGCSQGDNNDLILSPRVTSSETASVEADSPTPIPTNPGGVAIDRSALPTTPPVVSASSTTTTTVLDSSTTSDSSSSATDQTDTATDSNATTTTVAAAPTSTLAPSNSITWLWPSLSALSTAWDTGRTTINGSPFQRFDPTAATSRALSSGGQAFADRAAVPGGVLGGTIENDRDISSLLVIIPGTVDLSAAMQSVWVTLDGTPAGVPIFDGMQRFSEFVAQGVPAEGTQLWLGSNGNDYSTVITVINGSLIGSDTNAIEVAVIPVEDQGLAQSMAQPFRVEILSLLA